MAYWPVCWSHVRCLAGPRLPWLLFGAARCALEGELGRRGAYGVIWTGQLSTSGMLPASSRVKRHAVCVSPTVSPAPPLPPPPLPQRPDALDTLLCLLDFLHEDLNRVRRKPYVSLPESSEADPTPEALAALVQDTASMWVEALPSKAPCAVSSLPPPLRLCRPRHSGNHKHTECLHHPPLVSVGNSTMCVCCGATCTALPSIHKPCVLAHIGSDRP